MTGNDEAHGQARPDSSLSDFLPIDVTRAYTEEDVGLVDDIGALVGMVGGISPRIMGEGSLGIAPLAATEEFLRYTGMFDVTNPHMGRKVGHSIRVALLATELAEEARGDSDGYGTDISPEVAFLTGLLHDTGRFPQFAMHRSYDDSATGCDHGELGATLLSDHGLLDRFLPEGGDAGKRDGTQERDEARRLVVEATRWHNKKGLPDWMNLRERAYATLARDADIIDILRLWMTGHMAGIPFSSVRNVSWGGISEEVREAVMERRTADKAKMRGEGDRAIGKALLPWELSPVARRTLGVTEWIRVPF